MRTMNPRYFADEIIARLARAPGSYSSILASAVFFGRFTLAQVILGVRGDDYIPSHRFNAHAAALPMIRVSTTKAPSSVFALPLACSPTITGPAMTFTRSLASPSMTRPP